MIVQEELIERTQQWVRSFIVELNICPFAKHVIDKSSLRTRVIEASKQELALEELVIEMIYLDQNESVETTLLIFSDLFKDFFDYLDFVDLAEALMHEQGYEGVYQLATFHPDYCFSDTEFNDVANYTNRSPYPMLHLLREDSLDKAIAYFGDTKNIPTQNIAKLRDIGLKKIEDLLTKL